MWEFGSLTPLENCIQIKIPLADAGKGVRLYVGYVFFLCRTWVIEDKHLVMELVLDLIRVNTLMLQPSKVVSKYKRSCKLDAGALSC